MSEGKIKFIEGHVGVRDGDDGDTYPSAAIDCVTDIHWLSRIVVYGETIEDAIALRERLLWALDSPTKPDVWQFRSKADPELWHNCADVGEAVQAKAEGYEVRALFIRNPLQTNTGAS